MKKIVSSILLIPAFFISCSKDFTDLSPISSVSTEVLYKTNKDFQDALTATYNTLQEQYRSFYLFGDVRGDDSWQEIVKNNSQSYCDAFVTASSDPLMNSTWQNYYRIIFRANTILTKIETADAATITNKDRFKAEAKFLRALAYFDLVRIFGDVPKVTVPVSIEDGYKLSREKVSKIYQDLIIPDLMEADSKLPVKYTAADIGRPTKGAAKSMLGKVYLTIKDFVKAEEKLQEVTTMGYALLPNFKDLYDYSKDEHHSEYIFDVEYLEGVGEGSNFTHAFMPNFASMLKMYNVIGNGDEQNSPTAALIELFTPNDLRKDITVGVKGGYINASSAFVPLPANTSQTYTKKYIVATSIVNDSKANWKVTRYADVLLMLAEALNENNKTDLAIQRLNEVRKRAGVTLYSNLTKDEARDKIMLERRLELAFEGHRWFDLVRTGQAYKVMKNYNMLPHMTVFPLPLSQVQLINNSTLFAQNEGYN